MFRRIGLAPIVVLAGLAVAACDPGPVAPANQTYAVEENQSNTTSSQGAPTGGVCGTIAGIQCSAATDFCKMPDGQCKVPDAAGTCTAKPDLCPTNYKPVCGCDGKTYSNACRANMAGVNVATQGKCEGGEAEAAANAGANATTD